MKKSKPRRQGPTQSNQKTLLLATDRQNSVLTELESGDLAKVRYSAYGQRSAELHPTTSMAFNGEFREPDTGWYLLGNGYRAYNPVLMRFHSPDSLSPFGEGGLNSYAYCVGDPVNHSDPTGHFAWSLLFRAMASRPLQSIAGISMIAGATTLIASAVVPKGKQRTTVMAVGGGLISIAIGLRLVAGSSVYKTYLARRRFVRPPRSTSLAFSDRYDGGSVMSARGFFRSGNNTSLEPRFVPPPYSFQPPSPTSNRVGVFLNRRASPPPPYPGLGDYPVARWQFGSPSNTPRGRGSIESIGNPLVVFEMRTFRQGSQ